MFCHTFFAPKFNKKFVYVQLLEYTQAKQTVGTPAFRRAFEKTALSRHDCG